MKKRIILLVVVTLFVTFNMACDKVNNELSQVRSTSVSVSYGDDDSTSGAVDLTKNKCCPTDTTSGEEDVEPFYNAKAKFVVKNSLTYRVVLTNFYFVVKNYYGDGNDFVSSDIALMGNTELQGVEEGGADTETTVYGYITNAYDGKQYFPGSTDAISAVGLKNVVFYVNAVSEVGENLVFSSSIAVDYSDYDMCQDDYYAC